MLPAGLPPECRPRDLAEGYAVQARLPEASGERVVGWKLAATNPTGQAHIGVDAPIPGRLLASRVVHGPAELPFGANRMAVAEAELAFTLGADLPPREAPYSESEVAAAVASAHPALELPDSRIRDFARAGAAQLAADDACAHWLIVGEADPERWCALDLAALPATLRVNGEAVVAGTGADVLGGPLTALAWLANAHAVTGGLAAGDLVTTGVLGRPWPIRAGDRVEADLGPVGRVAAALV